MPALGMAPRRRQEQPMTIFEVRRHVDVLLGRARERVGFAASSLRRGDGEDAIQTLIGAVGILGEVQGIVDAYKYEVPERTRARWQRLSDFIDTALGRMQHVVKSERVRRAKTRKKEFTPEIAAQAAIDAAGLAVNAAQAGECKSALRYMETALDNSLFIHAVIKKYDVNEAGVALPREYQMLVRSVEQRVHDAAKVVHDLCGGRPPPEEPTDPRVRTPRPPVFDLSDND